MSTPASDPQSGDPDTDYAKWEELQRHIMELQDRTSILEKENRRLLQLQARRTVADVNAQIDALERSTAWLRDRLGGPRSPTAPPEAMSREASPGVKRAPTIMGASGARHDKDVRPGTPDAADSKYRGGEHAADAGTSPRHTKDRSRTTVREHNSNG